MLAGALEGLEATLALAVAGLGTRDSSRRDRRVPVPIPDHRVDRHHPAARGRAAQRSAVPDARRRSRTSSTTSRARGRGIFLRASPIDVSRIVREALFDRFRTVVLTSATLAVDGSFDYVKGRLGIREADELRVPSEFDYARAGAALPAARMPPPKSPAFAEAVARETIELLKRSRGRAFVLFTSYAVLRAVQPFVEMALPYPVLVQGTAPRSALIETVPLDAERGAAGDLQLLAGRGRRRRRAQLRDHRQAAVRVAGRPGDRGAHRRHQRARGGDAFADYQVPLAILALQQGLGRLIRHRGDRGVLAVLDPRLRTMGYGRRFLASLPPAPVTHDLDAVGRFFM